MKTTGIGLGSNRGNRLLYILSAMRYLRDILKIENFSSVYLTKPWGERNQRVFLNMVVVGKTSFSPESLLAEIKKIENRLGRKRVTKWGARTIDIDILFYENEIIDLVHLKIPHPFIQKRGFVIIPLLEIMPEWFHPKLNKKIYLFLKPDFYKEVKKVIQKEALKYDIYAGCKKTK